MALIPTNFGVALGTTVVRNEEILAGMDSAQLERLLLRVGVRVRYTLGPGENSLILAQRAMAELLIGGAVPCDFILGVTQTAQIRFPHFTAFLQGQYFPEAKCPTMDINLGCSGFVYAYIILNALHRTGLTKNPILVCADTYNKFITERKNPAALLFSDAAVAMCFRADNDAEILATDLGGDGSGACSLCVGSIEQPDRRELFMDGAAVMQFTMGVVPDSIERVLSRAMVSKEDVDFFCLHQASAVVLTELARKLNIPLEKMPLNIDRYGNTVSCSIPLLLKELAAAGHLRKGTKILLAGFGVGLSWATCLIRI